MKQFKVNLNTKRNLKDRLRSLFARKFPELSIPDNLDDSFTSCQTEEHKPAFRGAKKDAPILRQALLMPPSKESHGKLFQN